MIIFLLLVCIILYRKENSLFDEMTNFVNQAFGNGKSDVSGYCCISVQCSSQAKVKGMTVGHGLGGAYYHIKAFELHPIPISKNISSEGLLGHHAGENTGVHVYTRLSY